jgi:hypothetical protein
MRKHLPILPKVLADEREALEVFEKEPDICLFEMPLGKKNELFYYDRDQRVIYRCR